MTLIKNELAELTRKRQQETGIPRVTRTKLATLDDVLNYTPTEHEVEWEFSRLEDKLTQVGKSDYPTHIVEADDSTHARYFVVLDTPKTTEYELKCAELRAVEQQLSNEFNNRPSRLTWFMLGMTAAALVKLASMLGGLQ